MSKKQHVNSTKQRIVLLTVFIILVLYTMYQGIVNKYLKYKDDLVKQIKVLRAKHIEISRQLLYIELEGNIEKEIQKRHLNLVKDQYPKVIYIEPSKQNSR